MSVEWDRPENHGASVDVSQEDVYALERAADALARAGDTQNAIALWALVLRLRNALNNPAPWPRAEA